MWRGVCRDVYTLAMCGRELTGDVKRGYQCLSLYLIQVCGVKGSHMAQDTWPLQVSI